MKKTKHIQSLIILAVLCFILNGCQTAMVAQQRNTPSYPMYKDIVDDEYPSRYLQIDSFTTVETDYFVIDIPKGWTMENNAAGNIYDSNGRHLGTIYSQTMYDNQIPIPGSGSEPLKYEYKSDKAMGLCYLCDEFDYTYDKDDEKQMIMQAYGGMIYKSDPMFVSLCKAILDKHSVEYVLDDMTIRRITGSLKVKKLI